MQFLEILSCRFFLFAISFPNLNRTWAPPILLIYEESLRKVKLIKVNLATYRDLLQKQNFCYAQKLLQGFVAQFCMDRSCDKWPDLLWSQSAVETRVSCNLNRALELKEVQILKKVIPVINVGRKGDKLSSFCRECLSRFGIPCFFWGQKTSFVLDVTHMILQWNTSWSCLTFKC